MHVIDPIWIRFEAMLTSPVPSGVMGPHYRCGTSAFLKSSLLATAGGNGARKPPPKSDAFSQGTAGGDGDYGYNTSYGPAASYSNLWVNEWLSMYSDPVAAQPGQVAPPLVLTRGVWAGGPSSRHSVMPLCDRFHSYRQWSIPGHSIAAVRAFKGGLAATAGGKGA